MPDGTLLCIGPKSAGESERTRRELHPMAQWNLHLAAGGTTWGQPPQGKHMKSGLCPIEMRIFAPGFKRDWQ